MNRTILALAALALSAGTAQAAPPSVNRLLSDYQAAYEICRGENLPMTAADCEQMTKAGRALKKAGYCFGKQGQSGYQMVWHRCTQTSLLED